MEKDLENSHTVFFLAFQSLGPVAEFSFRVKIF